ncbi:unnamed protein product [Macrosiphum euphorbiae]|uniref:Uncharacterized protein n=1 Tax=Macrosiphum euphorbiae TaxID=13131 RepID=A0AAV0WQE5_9HEMI|nr:unnamed protein product [Macrosiphum euphorbiae]
MSADAAPKKDIQPRQGHPQPGTSTNNPDTEAVEWKEVTKRGAIKKPPKATPNSTTKKKTDVEVLFRRRAPRTEAVTIADGETYASVMRLTTSCIDKQEHGIQIGKVRRTKKLFLWRSAEKRRSISHPPSFVKPLAKERKSADPEERLQS